ncbi:DUF4142 domain-containing protein [Pleurocapsales cyanobacterium LEGE 06147]|nr:DUF4142 domain-containing protein [Pleurocapsales cyanobacterium LEGE 06147]
MFKSKITMIVFSAIALASATGYKTATQTDYTATYAQTMPDRSPTETETTLSDSDREFVIEAAQGGIAEVQLGQLASQQASNNAVRQFGQRMVTDHTQTNNQLEQIASQKALRYLMR